MVREGQAGRPEVVRTALERFAMSVRPSGAIDYGTLCLNAERSDKCYHSRIRTRSVRLRPDMGEAERVCRVSNDLLKRLRLWVRDDSRVPLVCPYTVHIRSSHDDVVLVYI